MTELVRMRPPDGETADYAGMRVGRGSVAFVDVPPAEVEGLLARGWLRAEPPKSASSPKPKEG